MDTPSPTPLLAISELAEYLNVSERTIRGWRQTNKGPAAIRVAGALRWRRATVDAWLDSQTETTGGAA